MLDFSTWPPTHAGMACHCTTLRNGWFMSRGRGMRTEDKGQRAEGRRQRADFCLLPSVFCPLRQSRLRMIPIKLRLADAVLFLELDRDPAINDQGMAGDEGGFVRAEEADGVGDVFWFAHAAEWILRLEHFQK